MTTATQEPPAEPAAYAVAKCPRCRGWTRVLDGNWLVPHVRAGTDRVCPGSSRRTRGRVYAGADAPAAGGEG